MSTVTYSLHDNLVHYIVERCRSLGDPVVNVKGYSAKKMQDLSTEIRVAVMYKEPSGKEDVLHVAYEIPENTLRDRDASRLFMDTVYDYVVESLWKRIADFEYLITPDPVVYTTSYFT